MCDFYSTNTFRKTLIKLLKKPQHGYGSVKKDICEAFKNKSFEEIFNTPEMVRTHQEYKQIKCRIRNSHQNLSLSNGFRLIYLAIKGKIDESGNQLEKNKIIFLYIFPKRGPYKENNINQKQLDYFIVEYKKEIEKLSKHNITNDLVELVEIIN